jgi:hypothetical protein
VVRFVVLSAQAGFTGGEMVFDDHVAFEAFACGPRTQAHGLFPVISAFLFFAAL